MFLYLDGEGRGLHAQVSSSLSLQEKKKVAQDATKVLKEEAENLTMAQKSSRDDKQEEEVGKKSHFSVGRGPLFIGGDPLCRVAAVHPMRVLAAGFCD